MKNTLSAFALILVGMFWVPPAFPADTVPLKDQVVYLTEELNSCGSLLWELAGERFKEHRAKGELWVLTTHSGGMVEVFQFEGCFLMAIPDKLGNESLASRNYATLYNSFACSLADELVLAGKVNQAAKLYRMIARFDPNKAIKAEAELKFKLVENAAHRPQEEIQAEIRKRKLNVAALLDFTQAQSGNAKMIKDLENFKLR